MKKLTILLLLITGCAFKANYKKIRVSQYDNDKIRISYTGSKFMSQDRISDLCMLKAAEYTILSGYNRFSFISKNDTGKYVKMPTTTSRDFYDKNITYSYNNDFVRPQCRYDIIMNNNGLFDANGIINNLSWRKK